MEKSNNSTYKQSGKNKIPWRLFLLLLVAFLLRIWGISFGLPGIDHGDEAEVVNHAVRFGSGDLNPHRFQYGSLFQYLLFAFYGAYFLIGYLFGKFISVHQFAVYFINDPTVFYLIARALSAVFGTATLIIVYLIGKRIKGEEVGLIAALFLAFSYQHVVHSHYATVDAALTFFFTLAVYQGVILLDKNDLWRYLVAGFSVGLAMSIKFNGVIAAGTFIIAHFLSGRDRTVLHKLLCKKLWLGIASIFVGNFVASPYFYINLDVVLTEIVQLREFHAFSGFNLWVYLKEIIKVYWGVPLGALCVLGLIRSVITTNSKLLILFITASFVLCFASLHKYVEAKYILYSFPLFAVMGSHLFVECFARLKKRYLFLITFIVLVNPLYLIVNWDYEHAKKSIALEAREWVDENIPVNSKILLDNVGNAGPKIENSFENIKRQYQRALKHNLLKAEYLKLKLESSTEPCYNIIQIDCSGGFREDDYIRYRLWQDTEEIGHSLEYYREKEFEYIIITDRYFSAMRDEFKLVKEFRQGEKGIRIYKIDL
jgi:hypothetical protein